MEPALKVDEKIVAKEFKITNQEGSDYDEIKEKLLKNEIYAKIRDYSKKRIKFLLILKQVNF